MLTVSAALLATANAAASAAADGAKNAAFGNAVSAGIGSAYRIVARREGIIVLDLSMSGALTVSGNSLVIPDDYASVNTKLAADIDTGTWTLRVEKSSDASVYLTGSLGPAGGGADFTLSRDLEEERTVALLGITMRLPQFDTSTFVDDIVADMGTTLASPRNSNSYLRMANGASLYNSFGGGASQVRIASYATITAALSGHNSYFANNYAANVQFLTINTIAGHAATNTAVDVRNGFCAVLKANNTWEFAYHSAPFWGKRLYNGDLSYDTPGTQTKLSGGIVRCQPGPAIALPGESNALIAGYEMWPSSWNGTAGVTNFYGRVSRALYEGSKCFVLGAQLRLSKWNDGGTDDRASAFIVAQTGFDAYASPHPGYRYITDGGVKSNTYGAGYPYGAFDGSFGPWKRIVGTDWQWVYFASVTEVAAAVAGTPPPWGDWGTPWPWASAPTYAISEATFRSNPPSAPP